MPGIDYSEPRIGVFVCHCGTNIAAIVDVKKVVEEVKKLPGVVHAEDYMYMCSGIGQQLIINAIREKKLNGVVVAACTPSLHYETFARAVESAGLDKQRYEIVSIREYCSWVHFHDRRRATEKAIRIIAAAVARIRNNRVYKPIRRRIIKKALVIGGGIAGMTAAIDIANAGIPVILVEKEPTIGGRMIQLSVTFPTLDCAQCTITPKMAEVGKHPNIKLYTLSEVVDVSGHIGNFHVKIRKKPRMVDIEECRLCGWCSNACPVEVVNEFTRGLSKRKAIYLPFPQAVPAAYVIDSEHCTRCGMCVKVCPVNAINLDEKEEIIEEDVGAIVVATGFDLYDGRRLPEYGYGIYKNVIDSLQFEQLIVPSGPTKGRIVRLSDGKPVKTVVFIQCAGQRDVNHLPYCSKICCMYTAKQAMMYKSKVPDGKAYIFYIDVRTAGKGYEEFYRKVQEIPGITYIRGRVGKVWEDEDGSLVVTGVDTLSGELVKIKADLVVLALGMVPQLDRELAAKLKISVDENGFAQEVHPKLKPVETEAGGVYIAGAVQGPKDISESVAQASAAASKVIQLLSKDYIEKDPLVAEVDESRCDGCGLCVSTCPYGAISLEDGVARVNEVACEGCGMCAAACPVGAIDLRNLTEKHFDEMIKAIYGVKTR